MNGTWVEVRVITISEALEPISGIFYGLDCKGVAIEDPNDILGREQGPLTWDFADINVLEHRGEAAVVKGYFSEDDNVEEIVTYIEQKVNEIKELGINVGEGKVESEVKHEKDWADTWKQYYKPVLVGERIVVKPIWEEYEPKNDELVVELDPGMAFGTGTHETTRMCIQALERYVSEDATVFDVGCGSGILAEIICILTDDVKRVLKDNGIFITSGIIHDRVDMVCEKLEATGFEVIEKNRDGEWNCIVAKLK